jgi:DnaJ-class molecular chaperone
LIELAVRPHPLFTRQGDDIVIELPITIDEAVLGGKVETRPFRAEWR